MSQKFVWQKSELSLPALEEHRSKLLYFLAQFFGPSYLILIFSGASLKAAAGSRADPLPLLPLPPDGGAGQALPLLPARLQQPPAHDPTLSQ